MFHLVFFFFFRPGSLRSSLSWIETHPNILRFLSDAGVSFDNSAESEDVERILREELRNAERRAAQEQEDHALALRLSQEVENVREVYPDLFPLDSLCRCNYTTSFFVYWIFLPYFSRD